MLPGPIQLQVLGKSDEYVQCGAWPKYEVPENVKDFQVPPLELEPTKRISGRLVDQSGQPVANRVVWVAADDRGYGFGQTNASGEFTLTGVPALIDAAKAKYQTGGLVARRSPSTLR